MKQYHECVTLADFALYGAEANARVQLLAKALRFYADPASYHEDYNVNFPFRDTKVGYDRGEQARAALAEAGIKDTKDND